MQLSVYAQDAPVNSVLRFYTWYRVVTFLLVVLLSVSSIKPVQPLILLGAAVYIAIIANANHWLTGGKVKASIYVLIDLTVSFALQAATGGYKSPFYLYSFAPILVGAFLGGYLKAFSLGIIQCGLFALALNLNGLSIIKIQALQEQPISDFFFYVAAALATAYLNDAVAKLGQARQEKEKAAGEFASAVDSLIASAQMYGLSKREAEVLVHLTERKNTQQIAEELGVSASTVRTYMRRGYEKLGVATKHKAIARALDIGEENA